MNQFESPTKPEKLKHRWRRSSELESGHKSTSHDHITRPPNIPVFNLNGQYSNSDNSNDSTTDQNKPKLPLGPFNATNATPSPVLNNATSHGGDKCDQNAPEFSLPPFEPIDENIYLFDRYDAERPSRDLVLIAPQLQEKVETQKGHQTHGLRLHPHQGGAPSQRRRLRRRLSQPHAHDRMVCTQCVTLELFLIAPISPHSTSRCPLGDHCSNKRFQKVTARMC